MTHKIHILQFTLIIILLFGIIGNFIGYNEPSPMEKTITTIKECTAVSPAVFRCLRFVVFLIKGIQEFEEHVLLHFW